MFTIIILVCYEMSVNEQYMESSKKDPENQGPFIVVFINLHTRGLVYEHYEVKTLLLR